MSASQYSKAANVKRTEEEANKPGKHHYHFVFDYPERFRTNYPGHGSSIIGCIPEWEFHVNENGQANVRPIFNTRIRGSQTSGPRYLMPIPGTKSLDSLNEPPFPAYGVVFGVDKEDDEKIQEFWRLAKYPRSRVLCIAIVMRDGKQHKLKVSVFADLRNTCNIHEPFTISSAETKEWQRTFRTFQKEGVPEAYLHSIAREIQGLSPENIIPIHIRRDAYNAYHIGLPDIQVDDYSEIPRNDVPDDPLPPKAAFLQNNYYKKYGTLAPVCPTNAEDARVFDDNHSEMLRGQRGVVSNNVAQLKATASHADRISNRCDDGLDVYDAIRASRGQRPWKHPDTAGGDFGEEETDEAAIARQKAAPKVVSRGPVDLVAPVAPVAPANPKQSNKKKPPRPEGASPAKKQKVQQPKANAGRDSSDKMSGNRPA